MSTTPSQSPMLPGASAPQVPGRKVAGWLIVCFAVIPLAMAARGEGASYLWTGATMLAVGCAMALVPRRGGTGS